MRFAPICPVRYDPARYTNLHLVLAHQVLEDPSYADYYRSLPQSYTIILDNGTVENGQPDLKRLVEAYELLNRKLIVVAPDYLHDSQATLEVSREFFECRAWRPEEVMVVPQGVEWQEWIECLRSFCEFGEFKYVGIPRVCEDFESGRSWLYWASRIQLQSLRRKREWKYHLLGIQHNISEVFWALHLSNSVVGVDSSLPIRAAYAGLSITDPFDLRTLEDFGEYREDLEEKVQECILSCVKYADGLWISSSTPQLRWLNTPDVEEKLRRGEKPPKE